MGTTVNCSDCAELTHHASACGWWSCGLTGAQVYPQGGALLLCPRTLPISERMGCDARDVARAVALAAHCEGRFEDLLSYYGDASRLHLRTFLAEVLEAQQTELRRRLRNKRTRPFAHELAIAR